MHRNYSEAKGRLDLVMQVVFQKNALIYFVSLLKLHRFYSICEGVSDHSVFDHLTYDAKFLWPFPPMWEPV